MIEFPHDIIPCIPRDGYRLDRDPAVNQQSVVTGGTRNRWENPAPSYQVDMVLDLSDAQYATWQSFFAAINHGADWFLMDVDVGLGIQSHQCHLRSMYDADMMAVGDWKVSVPLEVRLVDAP